MPISILLAVTGAQFASLAVGRRQRTVTAFLVLATLVAAIVAENWVAEQLDDHLVATMLMLIAGVVIIALMLPFVARFR